MSVPNPSEMATSDGEEIVIADVEKSPNKVGQGNGNGTNSNTNSDEGDSMDFDLNSFIRVRTEGDGIFEDDGDDEFVEDYSQIEIEPEPPTRKRKQEMNFRQNELIELEDEPEFHQVNFSLEPDIFQVRRRDRMPLYLLDPDDYAYDPKKQIQIRRAIITYRHHQEKKAQIIRLTEESKRLREHNETLKAKLLELASCGCQKNKVANLDVLDVKVPIVPPRMYVRGNRPLLAVPYNKYQFPVDIVTPSERDNKHQIVKAFDPPPCPIKVPEIPKPLVNIASNRLQQIISSSTLSSVNVASTTSPPTTSHVTASGNRTVVTSQVPARVTNFLQKNVTRSGVFGGGDTIVKTEPGILTNQSNGAMTASRIVFAKGSPAPQTVPQAAPQTASQLLFAAKQNAALKAQRLRPSAPQRPPALPMTFSTPINQRFPMPALTPMRQAHPMGTLLRTASGQVLRLVTQPPTPNGLKTAPGPSRPQAPRYQHILPKPQPFVETISPPVKRITKEDLKDMWSRFDDDDEDELAIIAAINGRSPSPEAESTTLSKNSRKQSLMGKRKSFESESSSGKNQIIRTNGTEIELNKYADIVFEEAD